MAQPINGVNQRRVPRTLVLAALILLQSCSQAAVQAQAPGQQDEIKTWVYPVLRYGLNNQKRDLRHALALAKALGVGVIMPGMWKHYRDIRQGRMKGEHVKKCFQSHVSHYLPFEQVLDRQTVNEWVPTVSAEELKQRGWDGKLDAMVVPNVRRHQDNWNDSWYVRRALKAEAVAIPPRVPQIVAESPLMCETAPLEALKQRITQYKYVGLQTILMGYADMYNLVDEARGPNSTVPEKATCHYQMHHTNGLLQPSGWIRDVATRYIREVSSIGKDSFIAAHIRPYPDECLDAWRTGNFVQSEMDVNCAEAHRRLHERVGSCLSSVYRRTGARHVFIMTHPAIRSTVADILSKAGVEDAVFLDPAAIAQLAGCQDDSSTFLSLIEDAVAMQAKVFIGTHTSSITHTIAYERMGRNVHQDDMYFEFLDTCGAEDER